MRSHVYYTHHALESIDLFSDIAPWSALHHERLDGKGYPFRYSEDRIPLGARIIAAADVFTGITEDRPYRAGMPRNEAREVLGDLAKSGGLDGGVIGVLLQHFDDLNAARIEGQRQAAEDFRAFRAALAHG